MEVDQSPPEAGDNKVEKPSQNALDQTVERHSKELRKAASAETVKYQAQVDIMIYKQWNIGVFFSVNKAINYMYMGVFCQCFYYNLKILFVRKMS